MPDVILITGSNSGFGRLTAEALARRGHTVVATMRDVKGKNAKAAAEMQDLARSAQLKLHVVEMDVTSDGSVTDGVGAAISIGGGRLDVAINNAGVLSTGMAETSTPDLVRRLFEVNYLGVQRVNRAVIPTMRKQGSGLLVHISTEVARYVLPFMAHYAATKAAVECLAESYRYELASQGIDSVLIEPGPFPTEVSQKSLQPDDPGRAAEYGPTLTAAQKLGEALGQLFSRADGPKPQEVADAIVKVVETPAGQRPLRTLVDRFWYRAAEATNATAAQAQAELMKFMGMTSMLSVAPAAK
jgi:NAD(P)-dependent dehydrogenase (short-subunit alcohol dehydrogenase family)